MEYCRVIEKGVLSVFDYVSIRPGSEEQRLIDGMEKRGADGDYQVKEMDAVLNRRPGICLLYTSYGPYQFPEKLIPLFINNIRHGKPLPVYGRGEKDVYKRQWLLYVVDWTCKRLSEYTSKKEHI